jgi:Xaa-Pro dipeptidase
MSTTRRSFITRSGLAVASFGFVPGFLDSHTSIKDPYILSSIAGDIQQLTDDDYLLRMEKARKFMKEKNMDALFITGETDLSYFTNVSWWQSERLFGVLLHQKGDIVWICPAFEAPRAAEKVKFGRDNIRLWEEHENPYRLIPSIMNEFGSGSGTLGIAPAVSSFVFFGLQDELQGKQLKLVDGSVVTQHCRAVKTKKEIAFMDLANKITKFAYREAFNNLQEGMTVEQLSGMVSEAHIRLGAKNGGGWPQFGPTTAFPHGSNVPHDLKNGDVVMIDGGCSVEGFNSDVTRTIIYGKPSDKQKRIFDTVLKAQQAAFNAARPGVPCENVDMAARKVITDAGYGPAYTYFAHRVGHGIGMQGHEYPYLVQGNKLLLEPGMTFSNEPGIYIYNEFGMRTEDCFYVTEEGAKWLGGMIAESLALPFGEDLL